MRVHEPAETARDAAGTTGDAVRGAALLEDGDGADLLFEENGRRIGFASGTACLPFEGIACVSAPVQKSNPMPGENHVQMRDTHYNLRNT